MDRNNSMTPTNNNTGKKIVIEKYREDVRFIIDSLSARIWDNAKQKDTDQCYDDRNWAMVSLVVIFEKELQKRLTKILKERESGVIAGLEKELHKSNAVCNVCKTGLNVLLEDIKAKAKENKI